MAKLPVIGIEYCHECGYLSFALKLAEGCLRQFEGKIGGVLVTPSAGGAYEITMDTKSIYSTFAEGFPTQDEAMARIASAVAQPAAA